MTNNLSGNIIGLDIGDSKVGVARMHVIAKIPEPLLAFNNDENFPQKLSELLQAQNCNKVIVGIPRNMSGEETHQSAKIREFVKNLKPQFKGIEFIFVDESLSSVRADDYIKKFKVSDSQDSVAACYILEEYLTIKQ